MLDYKVLIHIDRLWDYSDRLSQSWRSCESDMSGIPNHSLDEEWPVKYTFSWHLGVLDGQPDPRRISVHDRLGEHRRDHSPPGGNGRGAQRQFPPDSWHDFARGRGDANGSSRHGSFRSQQTGGYRRRNAAGVGSPTSEFAGAVEDDGGKRTGRTTEPEAVQQTGVSKKALSEADPVVS